MLATTACASACSARRRWDHACTNGSGSDSCATCMSTSGRPRARTRPSPGDGIQEDLGDLARLLVEREVPGIGNRREGDGGTFLEHSSLLVGQPDVVVLP